MCPTNPTDGTEAVFASTGRGDRFPSDNWGTTYIFDTEFDESGDPIGADVRIIYDGDDAGSGQFEHPDFGLRSPDNLDWADNGKIYLNEDRSTNERLSRDTFADPELFPTELELSNAFGARSFLEDGVGEEASIWELDPNTGELTRIAKVDRSAVPDGQVDTDPNESRRLGDFRSSRCFHTV